MNKYTAALVGGLVAGVVTATVMMSGRKSGLLGKTLDRDAVDWIDRTTGSRALIGDTGTSIVEFVNHLGASAILGLGYAGIRKRVPKLSPAALGAVYGTGLYLINIVEIAPLLGITQGEGAAGPRKAAERWMVHVLQSVVTALIADRLATGSSA